MTTTKDPALKTAIPDLRDLPLDKLGDAPSGLAEAIRTYRDRLKENGVPLSSFNARI